ncbi:proton-conducting transporter transmembrane domain-containing protein [Mycolicibacterium palauense]|uniref:proton-conducting transporter transmembrane domain-containing protein n=1 Tax=Mycolicibacterium palauense TaxID=2034511 RepID=UPI000BFEF8E3|nr:proton-conducting transporter membrane subunit [Mycolicibacterium palauense]
MTTPAQLVLWSLVALPAAAGSALLLARLYSDTVDRVAAAVSVAVAAATAALATAAAVLRPAVGVAFVAGADFGLRVDTLAATVVPVVAAVTLLVLVFATGDPEVTGGRFHGMMLLFASAALITATATTLPTLLLAWELMGAASYALIGYRWGDDERVSAGLTAFVTTRSADLGLYLAAGAALAGGAGLALSDLAAASPGWRHVLAAGLLVAALGKAAQLPFSFWLSRAMHGPSPVSALLHSAAMVAMGAYLLLRTAPVFTVTGWAATAAAWIGMATAVLLGAVAVTQRDLKQLLAASTAAQLGFVVVAAAVGSISGGAAQLVAHACTKAGLFLAAGAWLTLLGTKRIADLRGAARVWPVIGVSASVSALALAGVAPLPLWATKDAVLAAALDHSRWLYVAGLAATALSAAYSAKILATIWRRDVPVAGAEGEPRSPAAPTVYEQLPLVVLAAGAALGGVLALPPLAGVLSRALDGGPGVHAGVAELAGSALLTAVVVLAVLRWGVPEPRWALDWLGLGRITGAAVVAPTMALARGLARFDDRVLDRGVQSVADGTLRLAAAASIVDRRGVDAVVDGLAAGTRRLGAWARTAQGGQLHRYYMAAVVALAAGVLLLVVVR